MSVKKPFCPHLQRNDPQFFQIFNRAFCRYIKKTHPVDRVIKPFQADRIHAVKGKYIQDLAPHGKLADRIHLIGAFIPHAIQGGQDLRLFHLIPYTEFQRLPRHAGRTRLLLQQRFRCYEHDSPFLSADKTQSGRTPRLNF